MVLGLLFSCLTVRRHRCAFAFGEHCFVWEDARLLGLFIANSSVSSSRPRPSRTPTALLLNPTTQPSLVRRGEEAGP